MRRLVVLALAGALMVPAAAAAQSPSVVPEASPSPSGAPGAAEVAYACVTYDPTAYEDADSALVDGGVELVDAALCTLATSPVEPVAIKEGGKGTKRSKPFVLPAGDYEVRIKWGKGCPYTKGAQPGEMYLNLIGDDGDPLDFEQSTPAYGIEAGRYYMKVETVTGSRCSWSFGITSYAE